MGFAFQVVFSIILMECNQQTGAEYKRLNPSEISTLELGSQSRPAEARSEED